MKIYNEDKTRELNREEIDLNNGYLITEKELVHHEVQEYIPEKGHYITLAEYPNGGKDVEWVVDAPMQEERDAYDEEVEYQKYIEYTKEELLIREYTNEIFDCKQYLNDTDYLVIKYIEGWLDEKKYQEVKAKRQSCRDKINKLEDEIKKLSK